MPARNTIEIIISAKDEASKALGSVTGVLGDIGKAAAIGATAIVGATTAIGAGMFELAREAAPIEGISKAFEGVAKASGKSADEMLKALSAGSKGMVTNTELMKSYNSAAQLVSTEFANQLPDAMKYLSKVSAATGQDMGFMLDSLVKGVGRVSPMILDNLGIQVNATEAMEEYAAANGKVATELTKTEQQAAIMAKTLKLLEKNTAAMPDITDNAATKWAQFQTRLANFKDDLGVKLLPFFEAVINVLMKIGDAVMPILMPAIENLASIFQIFFNAISEGYPFVDAFRYLLMRLFGEGAAPVADFVSNIINGIQRLIRGIGLFIKDVQSMGIVDAIAAAFGVGGGMEGESWIVGVIRAFGLTSDAAIQAVYTIGNILGGLIAFITGTALPVLQKFGAWFTTEVLPAVVQFITGTVIPAIQRFISILQGIWGMVAPVLASLVDWFINTGLPLAVGFIRDTMLPYIQKLIDGIMVIWEKVQPGLQNLFDWFVTTGLPAITGFIENTAIPIVSEIIRIIGDIWTAVAPALGDLAAWFLEDALPGVVNFIEDTVLPTIQSIIDILSSIWTIVQPFLSSLKDGVTGVMNKIKDAIQPVVEFIEKLIGKFQQVQAAVGGGVQAWQGAADNAKTAANLVTSGQVSPGDFLRAFGNAISSEFTGHALGLNMVPEDGLYKLHKGERVNTAAESQYGTDGRPVEINFYGTSAPANQTDADEAGFMLVNSLRANGMAV